MSEVSNDVVAEAVRQVIAEVRQPHAQTLELTTVQKAVGTLFLAGCAWVGATVQSSTVELATIRERLNTVTVDRYSSKDAERDLHAVNERHNGLERRVTVLEGGKP